MNKKEKLAIGQLLASFASGALLIGGPLYYGTIINEKNKTIDRLLLEKSEAKTELIYKKSDAVHSNTMFKLNKLLFLKDVEYNYIHKPDGGIDSAASTVSVPLNSLKHLK